MAEAAARVDSARTLAVGFASTRELVRQRATARRETIASTAGRPASQPAPRPDKRYSFMLGLMIWVMVAMIIPKNIFATEITAADFNAPNPLLRITKISLIALSAFVVYAQLKKAKRLMRSLNPFFIAMVALAPISTLWSISPGDTNARCVSFLTIAVVAFAFSLSAWNPTRLQSVMRPALTTFLFASICFCLIYPALGIEKGSDLSLRGSWHGLAAQKNEFGQVASFGVIFWAHAFCSRQLSLWKVLVGIAITGTCLVSSRSSTSLFATLLACIFMLLVTRATSLRRYLPYITGIFASLTVTYALAVLGVIPGLSLLLEPVMALTGKDATFSGRSQIWAIIREHIQLSPWVGSGYGAYWIGNVPWSPSSEFMRRVYFYPTESHNGYLEIINDLGFLGLACLFGFLIVYVRNALRLLKVDRAQAALVLGIFFQQVIVNLSESCWFSYRAFGFNVLALSTVSLARSLMDIQTQRPVAR